ncbi:hypoxanthine phosphoribosyltransferase [Candidatus Saccharibacteria bacterium]|nr:MAG: hypoxanthine phosphoribosyltransferase [Candidatus Saccharibacteria bacterium]
MLDALANGVMVGDTKMTAKELFSAQQIKVRIRSLAQEIAAAYAPKDSLHTVTVLNGSLHFSSELRLAVAEVNPRLGTTMTSDTIHLASYHGTGSTGEVRKISDLTHSVADKHVLVVEDIIDTGKTLSVLLSELRAQKPASLAVAALLRKPEKLLVPKDDLGSELYVGFDIGPEFVIGYGLDYDDLYRDLSAIYALSPAAQRG